MTPARDPDLTRRNRFAFTYGVVLMQVDYWGGSASDTEYGDGIGVALDQVMLTVIQGINGINRIQSYVRDTGVYETVDPNPTTAVGEHIVTLNGQTIRVRVQVDVQHKVPDVFLAGVFEPMLSSAGAVASYVLDPEGTQLLHGSSALGVPPGYLAGHAQSRSDQGQGYL